MLLNQSGNTHIEGAGDFLYILQGNVFLSPFDHPDVGSVNSCLSGQFFLRKTLF